MKNANKFFELAKKQSIKSDHPDHKHGCVIVYKNKVVASGYNKHSSHPKSTHPYSNLHAEMNAIFKLKQATNKHILYVYREHKDGSMALSKPCQHCEQIIRLIGITTVVYTIEHGWNVEAYG